MFYITIPLSLHLFNFFSPKVLLNYLPGIRDPVRKFLVSLRDWPVSENFDFVIFCQNLNINFHNRCRWATVHCLTPCTRRRWRSSSSFIGRFPKPQQSGRDAKAAVHNTGDTLVPFGSLSKSNLIRAFNSNVGPFSTPCQ